MAQNPADTRRGPRREATLAAVALAASAAITLSVLGCARGASPAHEPHPFGPEDAALFDDTIAASAFDLEAAPTEDDPSLQARVERAEFIIPVTVVTVTRDRAGASDHYHLELRRNGDALGSLPRSLGELGAPKSRRNPVPERYWLTVPAYTASYGLVRAGETTLIGKPLILLVRRQLAGGREKMHWRVEQDCGAVRAVVARVRSTTEARSSAKVPAAAGSAVRGPAGSGPAEAGAAGT
jgi:hypothetical protein